MGKMDLQCLFIGRKPESYLGLVGLLNEFNFNIRVKKTDEDEQHIIKALRKMQGAGIVFISDEASFPLTLLSDLIWQYSQDAIVIILSEKVPSTSFKKPLNNIVFARLNVRENNKNHPYFLGSLIHIAQLKKEFRQCKRLLGISEKRCQWLVDSSNQAIAYISRDLHLYANPVYLKLFDIESLQDLHSIPVQEFIVRDEYALFKDFLVSRYSLSRSLVITLRKRNNATFRASIVAIPAVFKGKKCLQLWVHPLESYKTVAEQSDKTSIKIMEDLMRQQELKQQGSNPFEGLEVNNKAVKQEKEITTSLAVLKGVIRRNEALISTQKLTVMKKNEAFHNHFSAHYLLSLKTPVSLKRGIEKLLFYPVTQQTNREQIIFWDKVKFARLLQILIKRERTDKSLLIRFNGVSASDNAFTRWFISNLKKIPTKTTSLTFLVSSQLDEKQKVQSFRFIDELRMFNCKIALDDFSASKGSLMMLRQVKPEYVRLSLPWIISIEGNSTKEIALASFIRQLESKKIRIIAPCGLSKSMRRLFTLSGVSFCQERVIKAG